VVISVGLVVKAVRLVRKMSEQSGIWVVVFSVFALLRVTRLDGGCLLHAYGGGGSV